MYRFSTFPEPGAAEESGAADAATVAPPCVPGLPPPQASINKAHPSARIAVRRKLNIKQIPFVLRLLYIAAGAPGTEPDRLKGAALHLPLQRQTFSRRCSRSQELMTCAKVSYSASLTAVNASTKRS